MKNFGLVDDIIPEPAGGAHWDYNEAAAILKSYLIPVLQELKRVAPEERIAQRIEKFGKMGFWDEADVPVNGEQRNNVAGGNATT